MARNKGISSLPNLSMLSAVPASSACRQPVRLWERLLGVLWAVLAAFGAAASLPERS